ncbi:MAG: hypothetical protein ACJ8HI_12620 [Massilia sp.]
MKEAVRMPGGLALAAELQRLMAHDHVGQMLSSNRQEIRKMMEWIPVVLVTFKLIVLATGMFFAIKWHYDQGKKDKDMVKQKRAVLLATGKVAVLFVLSMLVLTAFTVLLVKTVGLNLDLS